MCQASASSSSNRSNSSSSKSASPAVNLRKPEMPAASFRLSMRRDHHHRESHLLVLSPSSSSSSLSSPSSVTSHPLSLRYRSSVDENQRAKPTWLSFDEDNDEDASLLSPKKTGSVRMLTPKTPTQDVVHSVTNMVLDWDALSPPPLGPSSTADDVEYRSIASLPEAILIPDF